MTVTKRKLSLLERFTDLLVKNGFSQRKSKELAKKLAPAAKKMVVKDLAEKEKEPEKEPVKETALAKVDGLLPVSREEKKLVLRSDLEPIGREGKDGKLELLRPVMGLSSGKTYVAVAVRGDKMIAVRDLGGKFNTKFYPTLDAWGYDQDKLLSLGANPGSFLNRNGWYERMHLPQNSLDQLLARIHAEAKASKRVKDTLQRLYSVTVNPCLNALKMLYAHN
jgi:hypothetical protein